ncbi:MAG: hypothetical protein ACK5KQ_01980, partial [Anaerorhabdus sp.]
MKKSIRFLVFTIILVCITYLNVAFSSVNEINFDLLRHSSIGSAFSEYEIEIFTVDVKLDEMEEFVDIVQNAAYKNELVINVEIYKGAEDEYRYLYLYSHPSYNEILEFYMPYKAFQKPNFQGSYVLDHGNSAVHKQYFLFDYNINYKSLDNLKRDNLSAFYNFTAYGEKADIDNFVVDISKQIDSLNLKYMPKSGYRYNLFKYLYQLNRVSLIMMWASFLMMLYYVIKIIIDQHEEISIRKILGQSDLYITTTLIKQIAKITLTTVIVVCLVVNILLVRSLNFMLYGILLSEFILLLLFGIILLLCSLFLFLYVKKTVINQVVKASFSFIKSFNYYQVVKVIILVLMIYEIGPTIKDNLYNIIELNEINKYKDTMYKISSFTGFKGDGELFEQNTYEKYMEGYYNKDENIHVYSLGYADSKDIKRSYAVFTFDYRTAKYYGYDYDEPTVIINEKVYDDINFEM